MNKLKTVLSDLSIPILLEIGLILRLWNLGFPRFWYDEAFTAILSRLPYPQLLAATMGDTHPPLYYTLTWLATRLGAGDEFGLRMLSALFSMWALLALFWLCRDANLPRPVTIAAVALMALSPAQITYAQEARMYALLTWLVIEAVRAVLNREHLRLAIYGAALLYTHNYAVFYWPVIGLLAIARELVTTTAHAGGDPGYIRPGTEGMPQSQWARLLAALAGPVVLFIPWVVVLLGQMQIVETGYWIQAITPGAVIWTLNNLWWAFAMPEQWQGVAILLVLGIYAYSLVRGLQRARQALPWLWLGLAPLGLAIAASLLWKPLLLFRGLLGTLPFLYILLALLLFDPDRPRLKRAYAAALLAPTMLAGLLNYYLSIPAAKSAGALMTQQMVVANWQPGDVIATINDGGAVIAAVYASGLPLYEIDGGCPSALGSLSAATRRAMGIPSAPWELITGAHKRVWLLGSVGPTASACEEALHARLTGQARPVIITTDTDIALDGVWLYENNLRSSQTQP